MEELRAGMKGVRVIKKCFLDKGGYAFSIDEILAVRKREVGGEKLLDVVYALNDPEFSEEIDIFYGETVDDVIRDEDGTLKIVLTGREHCIPDKDGYSLCGGSGRTCLK